MITRHADKLMNNRLKWLPHPSVLFLFSVAALAMSLFLCIYWYIEVKRGLEELIGRLNFDPLHVFQSRTWIVIIVLTLLIGVVLSGIFLVFVYYQKVLQLYRLQQNFINNFTHELKTPVTSLKLYLETFLRHELEREEMNKYMNYMVVDLRRLSDNINSILNLAKIESDNFEGEFESEDVMEFVEQFCENNRHLFRNCEIEIEKNVETTWDYPLNRGLFEMLLMNIITNAMKYNNAESVRMTITFQERGRHIYIRFRDNGIGIEKVELKKVFRKFYRADNSGVLAAKGSGLGLYLVYMIARIHGGRVMAESDGRGQGTTFVIRMPIRPSERKWSLG